MGEMCIMSKRFVITCNSTADLPQEYIERNALPVSYLGYSISNRHFDGINTVMPPEEFYKLMREGNMTQTVQVNPDQALAMFEPLLQQGYDILHIAFSSGLSGTYNSMKIAAEELKEKYPDRKIIVIDGLSASLGEGLLVYKAVELRAQGRSMDEVAQWVEDNKLHICHYFTVDDLNFLYRGGRVSKTAAVMGTMLGIKPVLHVDNAGKLIPLTKVRGRKQSLIKLVDYMQQTVGNYKNDIVFISHGDCLEDAQFVADLVTKRMGIKNFLINYVGPTIGAHSGPGTIALFFMGTQR